MVKKINYLWIKCGKLMDNFLESVYNLSLSKKALFFIHFLFTDNPPINLLFYPAIPQLYKI